MRERFQRYAIYWTPPDESAIAAFGARWFNGFDTFGLPPRLVRRATEAPAHYRLHATLKAPFRLRDELPPEALSEALDAFCAKRRAPFAGSLMLASQQRYLALMLRDREVAVDWLAAECVTHFDRFRAALNEEDLTRREIAKMSAQEKIFLAEFGYPYVLSAFRFHISLAGPLTRIELAEVAKALAPPLAPFIGEPFRIEDLTLVGEPKDGGVFETISRHRF